MSGDDELGVAAAAVLGQQTQQFDLAGRRERRLRLVQEVQPGDLIATAEVGQKALSVRPPGQTRPPVVLGLAGVDLAHVVEEFGPLPEGLRAEDPSPHRASGQGDADVVAQPTVLGARPPAGLWAGGAARRLDSVHMCSPQRRAIASMRVDLPDPFSPTKKLTLRSNLSSCRPCRGAMLNG